MLFSFFFLDFQVTDKGFLVKLLRITSKKFVGVVKR